MQEPAASAPRVRQSRAIRGEGHAVCGCWGNCLLTLGRIMQTPGKGYGLRAAEHIKEGALVLEYLGERLDEALYQQRLAEYEVRPGHELARSVQRT